MVSSNNITTTIADNGGNYGYSGDDDPAASAQFNEPVHIAIYHQTPDQYTLLIYVMIILE